MFLGGNAGVPAEPRQERGEERRLEVGAVAELIDRAGKAELDGCVERHPLTQCEPGATADIVVPAHSTRNAGGRIGCDIDDECRIGRVAGELDTRPHRLEQTGHVQRRCATDDVGGIVLARGPIHHATDQPLERGEVHRGIAQRMRQIPTLRTQPIVLMTAYALSEGEREAMMTSDGVDAILPKPLPDFEELQALLHNIHEKKQARLN